MIQFIVVFLSIYFLVQFLQVAWPVVGVLILLATIYAVVSRVVRRRVGLRRQMVAIRVARDQASAELGRARAEAEAAMWEEFRRHL